MDDEREPTEVPSGLPDEADNEPPPLGTPDPEAAPDEGAEAMPGIAEEGEPPTSG